VELRPVVEDVLREHRQMLADRKIDVVIEDPLPAVWCHADRLKQVVTNLLRNAILHGCDAQRRRSPLPRPPRRDAAGQFRRRWAAFQVRDNGPGIEPSLHRKIFLPGWRPPRGAPTAGHGSGDRRKLVRQFGGKVYVDPACVRGAALVVSCPSPRAGDGTVTRDRQTRARGNRATASPGRSRALDPSRSVPCPSAAPARRKCQS